MASAGFSFPEFYEFPPFYTLQPVLETRQKQLKLWRDLVVAWHNHKGSFVLKINNCSLWENEKISRRLSPEGINAVVAELIKSGSGEWVDSAHSAVLIYARRPADLATEVYAWAESSGMLGGVYTLFELTSGEEAAASPLAGMETALVRRTIEVLQAQGKAALIPGTTSDEDGVKFMSL